MEEQAGDSDNSEGFSAGLGSCTIVMSNFGIHIKINTLPVLFYNFICSTFVDFICSTDYHEAYSGIRWIRRLNFL